nr:hypothetical protein [Desulfobacterales bacterium]
MRIITRIAAVLLGVFLLSGFSLENPQVPVEDILAGGPPKDGIPALLAPRFVPPGEARYLTEEDRVVGVHIGN